MRADFAAAVCSPAAKSQPIVTDITSRLPRAV